MRGVVMEQRQSVASRGQRHVGRILHRAVPPTDLAGVLLIAVLGVMDDEVRPLQERHMPLIARRSEERRVGKECRGGAVREKLKTNKRNETWPSSLCRHEGE